VSSAQNNNILPVILSGGSGSRLWPLSRASFPKQYLNFDKKNDYTLLQNTFIRLKIINNLFDPLIICNEDQRFIVAEQMREIKFEPTSILLEPFGKSTGPAVALAALIGLKKKNDPILLVLSSDHRIENDLKFKESIEEGIPYAKKGRLVTFGIRPSSPETGFGYIESYKELSEKNKTSPIKKFIEKPNQEIANILANDLHYSWNSGIFLFKASSILDELKKYHKDLLKICEESLSKSSKDLYFQRVDKDTFKKCPNISIDIAVMEKTNLGTVVSLNAGWNDLGSWKSIWENTEIDKNENSLLGKTIVKDVKNSYLRSENRLIVGIGFQNLIIVETEDALLVSTKESIKSLKDLIMDLENENIKEFKIGKKSHRPWGHYVSLIEDKTWQVKRIEIKPKESLSLQKHRYRAEHWIVVDGIAQVEINNNVFLLKRNESTFVPLGAKHRLSNPGETPLVLIEVQSGTYLGEDDIVRFEDKYRRKTPKLNNS